MLVLLASWIVPILGCASASPRLALEPDPAQRAPDAFPVPAEGLRIPVAADGETNLDELLNEFSRVTGHHLVVSDDTTAVLRALSTGLNRSVDVPAAEVYPFVESVLAHNQCVLEVLSDREPRLLAVHHMSTVRKKEGRGPSPLPHFVPADQLDRWAAHPAVLVTTTVELPWTDVRTLSNSMRSLFDDGQTQLLVPIGNTSSLVVSGTGSWVGSLVRLLREADADSKRAEETRAKSPPPAPAPESKPAPNPKRDDGSEPPK